MQAAVADLVAQLGVAPACAALRVPRSQWYRRPPRAAPPVAAGAATAAPAGRALSAAEEATVLAVLNSARFVDQAPREVFATLLDEGQYYCSWRQMYRILAAHAQVQERRNQLRHPAYTKPELLALRPNTVWSWDITKLRGPQTWTYYYLYVVLDIFSRYVVGWMVAEQESADLARTLIADTCAKYAIARGQLTLHADRGAAMVSHTLAQLLAELGVSKSHSRPHVSDDNPYSEAQFKTAKYHPDYPERFASAAAALEWARAFFRWYNQEHHHTGLALLTPADVHLGRAAAVIAQRQHVLGAAYARHPERFVKGVPIHPPVPTQVWINPPNRDATDAVDPQPVH